MLDQVLSIINTVVIVLVSIVLFFQTIYFFAFPFKYKKYPKAKKQHKYGVIICAHNEEKVIGNLLDSLNKQDYPKELIDVFVLCHNCTDKTKEVALSYGATVFEHNSPNEKHAKKGYALRSVFRKLLTDKYNHEGYILFDADNLAAKDFVSKMNDAFDAGNKVLQGFRNSKNLEDNVVSEANGIFHLRDSSFNNKARTLIHSSVLVNGTGFLFAREVIQATNGWNAFSLAEDAEFSIQFLLNGYDCKLVEEAEFYDEQPTKFFASLNRQARIGRGAFTCFFKYGHKLAWKFITTFKYKYLDAFINFAYAPISIITMLWFPAYYIYVPVMMLVRGEMNELYAFLIMVVEMICLAIILPVTIQNIIAYIQNRKRLSLKSIWKTIGGLLFFPIYNLCYALAITIGVFTPNFKWKHVDHTSEYTIEDMPGNNETIDKKENDTSK